MRKNSTMKKVSWSRQVGWKIFPFCPLSWDSIATSCQAKPFDKEAYAKALAKSSCFSVSDLFPFLLSVSCV